MVASGSRHTIPPVHNSPGVPRIIFQLTEQDILGYQYVVVSKYDKKLEFSPPYDSQKYLHPKPNFLTLITKFILKWTPYRLRKLKYGFTQPDRIVYYKAVIKKAKKVNPDIVVTTMHIELFKLLQKALPNSKHIYFFRSTDLKGRIGDDNIDFLLKYSSGFLANTQAPIDELRSIKPDIAFPMATIYNAVPKVTLSVEEQKNISTAFRQRFGLKNADFVIGYAGRFSEEKSLMELFEALKKIKDEGIIIHLVIAGDISNENSPNHPYYNLLMDYKEKYLQGLVHLAGWITNVDLYNFYCALDVGVVLSKYREGNSMFLIEAMSYGVPVIATAIGGNKEIISHNKNGILIGLDAMSDDLVRSITLLYKDSSKHQIFSDNARNYVIENHSKENMIGLFDDFINKL